MEITISFDTDNDVFQDPCGRAEEVQRIMVQATRIVAHELARHWSEPILDSNGNTIGQIKVTE